LGQHLGRLHLYGAPPEGEGEGGDDEGKQQKNGAPGDEQEFNGGQFGGWQTHGA
jgi:hypothetical protein